MFELKALLTFLQIWSVIQYSMAANICDQIQSGNYKTVYLSVGRIRLITGNTSYTFNEGSIKSAQIEEISVIYPNDLSPIEECFVNNAKIYYIRQNKAVIYEGNQSTSETWNPKNTIIPRLVIKRNDQTIGFFVPPVSQNSGSGQSMTQSNDLQVLAYGSGSSISSSYYNGNFQLMYNGWNIPSEFNAFLPQTDNSIYFFKANKYCVSKKNSNSNIEWKDVNSFFGC